MMPRKLEVQIISERICFICCSKDNLNPLIYLDDKRTHALQLVEDFYSIEVRPNKECKASFVCNECMVAIEKLSSMWENVCTLMCKLLINENMMTTKSGKPLYCHYFLPSFHVDNGDKVWKSSKSSLSPIIVNETPTEPIVHNITVKEVMNLRSLPNIKKKTSKKMIVKSGKRGERHNDVKNSEVSLFYKYAPNNNLSIIAAESNESISAVKKEDKVTLEEIDLFPQEIAVATKPNINVPSKHLVENSASPNVYNKDFDCNICHKTFGSKFNYKRHLSVHGIIEKSISKRKPRRKPKSGPVTSKETFTCVICHKIVKGNYFRHMDTHDRPRYPCDNCDKAFLSQDKLDRHKQKHLVSLVCEQCGYKAHKQSRLRDHINTVHSDVRTKMCGTCGKAFKTKIQLVKHELIHRDIKPYKCGYCSKTFVNATSRLYHERSLHTGDKPHQCSFCGKCFATPLMTRSHERVHTGEKPYPCNECPKKFRTSYMRSTHMKVHTGIKNYKCQVCLQCFATRKTLIDHERIHTGEKPYKCAFCDIYFRQTSSRSGHERSIHGNVGVHAKKSTVLSDEQQVVEYDTNAEMMSLDNINSDGTYHIVVNGESVGELNDEVVAAICKMGLDPSVTNTNSQYQVVIAEPDVDTGSEKLESLNTIKIEQDSGNEYRIVVSTGGPDAPHNQYQLALEPE